MALHAYGLLIGTITSSRPPAGQHLHWLLMVQPKDASHPPYRVAVNLQPPPRGKTHDAEYQTVKLPASNTLVKALVKLGATPAFEIAEAESDIPRLDWHPLPGLLVGTSFYGGDSQQTHDAPAIWTTLVEAHAEFRSHGFQARAIYARVTNSVKTLATT